MPWSKSRPSGSGTDAIYRTPEHRRARAALLAQHYEGAPCCLCSGPMYGPTRNLHADHCPTCRGHGCERCGGAGYRGLSHGACNRRDGSVRARARQTATRLQW